MAFPWCFIVFSGAREQFMGARDQFLGKRESLLGFRESFMFTQETLQACASISVSKLCNFPLPYLVNFVNKLVLCFSLNT